MIPDYMLSRQFISSCRSYGGSSSVDFQQSTVFRFRSTSMPWPSSSLVYRHSRRSRMDACGSTMWLLGSMQWLLRVVHFSLRSTSRKTVHVVCFSKLIVGGAPVTSWVYRACIVQGTQQIFAAGLWYWGHRLSIESAAGDLDPNNITTPTVTVVTWCLSVLLLAIGVSLYTGLPEYYRQLPGRIPA